MSPNQRLQSSQTHPTQLGSQLDGHDRRFYLLPELLVLLQMSRRTFFNLRRKGELPFLSEITPRLGRRPRYRADLVDRYLSGQWQAPRSFRRAV